MGNDKLLNAISNREKTFSLVCLEFKAILYFLYSFTHLNLNQCVSYAPSRILPHDSEVVDEAG